MYAGGQSRANGWRGDGGRDAILRRRRKPGPSSSSTSGVAAAAASSSSSGRAEEVEEEGGGNKQWWRIKRRGKREAVARAVSDGLPAAVASCWRGVTVVEETPGGRVRNQRRDGAADGSGHRGDHSSDGGPGPDTDTGKAPAAAAWCCVCPGGDCSLEPNPSANGKEDPGVRSLLERNDFFSVDCNPHAAAGLPSSAGASW